MTRVITFDVNKASRKVLKSTARDINNATNELYMEVYQNSPVDTWYYISRHRNKGIREEWDRIIWEVENQGEYPETLEEGWRKWPVNWHLQKWEIYYSVWADVYKKSVQKVGQKLLDKLKNRW